MRDLFNEKWFWKMEYCHKKNLPPAQSWAWELAETAYLKYKSEVSE